MFEYLTKDPITGKYELLFDSSAIKEGACNLRLINITVEGLKEKENYNDTQYGSAFHLFVSTLHRTSNFPEAQLAAVQMNQRPCIQRTNKNHLTDAHLVKTCIDFLKHSQEKDTFEILTVDGKPLVEQRFKIKLFETANFIVYLCGTIDAIGKFINGAYAIRDYKTRGLWKKKTQKTGSMKWIEEEIKHYLSRYTLSTQLRFYLTCIKMIGEQEPDTTLGKVFNQHGFGMFIEGIFTQPEESALFRKSEVFFLKDWEILEYKQQLIKKTNDIVVILEECLKTNTPYTIRDGIVVGACYENQYPCRYARLCGASDDLAREYLKKSDYTRKTYNPLTHGT